jgi:hypothetical protein
VDSIAYHQDSLTTNQDIKLDRILNFNKNESTISL